MIGIIKTDFMAKQLHLMALDCRGVPNKLDTDCVLLNSEIYNNVYVDHTL